MTGLCPSLSATPSSGGTHSASVVGEATLSRSEGTTALDSSKDPAAGLGRESLSGSLIGLAVERHALRASRPYIDDADSVFEH